jgi:hypothetical protein
MYKNYLLVVLNEEDEIHDYMIVKFLEKEFINLPNCPDLHQVMTYYAKELGFKYENAYSFRYDLIRNKELDVCEIEYERDYLKDC